MTDFVFTLFANATYKAAAAESLRLEARPLTIYLPCRGGRSGMECTL